MEGRLYLHQGAELRWVVLNVNPTKLIFHYVGMKTGDWNVVDSHICIVPPSQTNFLSIVKVYDVKLFLSLVVLLRRVHLERLNNYVVFIRLVNLENLMSFIIMSVVVFKLIFAELAVKSFPGVAGHVRGYFLIFISAQPLSQALQVNVLHRPSAFAGWDQGIILFRFIWEANPAHLSPALSIILKCVVHLFQGGLLNNRILVQFCERADSKPWFLWARRSIKKSIALLLFSNWHCRWWPCLVIHTEGVILDYGRPSFEARVHLNLVYIQNILIELVLLNLLIKAHLSLIWVCLISIFRLVLRCALVRHFHIYFNYLHHHSSELYLLTSLKVKHILLCLVKLELLYNQPQLFEFLLLLPFLLLSVFLGVVFLYHRLVWSTLPNGVRLVVNSVYTTRIWLNIPSGSRSPGISVVWSFCYALCLTLRKLQEVYINQGVFSIKFGSKVERAIFWILLFKVHPTNLLVLTKVLRLVGKCLENYLHLFPR